MFGRLQLSILFFIVILALFFIAHYSHDYPAPRPTSRKVLYATQDIQAGQKITPDMFTGLLTPNNIVPEGLTIYEANTVVKCFALRPIHKEDPLTEGNIGLEPPHLDARIPATPRPTDKPQPGVP